MAKSPGFWFFTGDWMKDPELRFCSIFARGLLVDLLCILFEAKERGYASNPDGTPRTDQQIVDAVAGSSREEKLAALSELEKSGVLSRDERGILFSRRLARLAQLSETRSKSGSQSGSKTQAKLKQTAKQKEQQNRGVSDSVSDSVTDSVTDSVADSGHAPFGRVSFDDARAKGTGEDIQGIWETFRQAWNATPNAEPYNALGCPPAVFEIVTGIAFQDGYPAALDRLAASTFFKVPAPMTWFLRNWERLLAGELKHRWEPHGKPKRKIIDLDEEPV